jgi:transcriptional regulator with XRE-family HTH domain
MTNREDKSFLGAELREILKKNNMTFRELAKKSGVSITYLNQIITHGKNPSMEIIEKIFTALDIDPEDFTEYRIIRFIRKLEKYFGYIEMTEIVQMEAVIDELVYHIEKYEGYNKSKAYKGKRELEFNPSLFLDITELKNDQIKIIKYLYNEFMESNNQKKLESKIMDKFLNEFTESEKFEEYLEKYKHLNIAEIYSIAYEDHRKKYLKESDKHKK